MLRRPERWVAAAALVSVVVPLAVHDPPRGAGQWVGAAGMAVSALLLAGWRRHGLLVLVLGPLLALTPLVVGPEPGNFLLLVILCYAALAAERFSGWAAWGAGAAYAAYLALLYAASGDRSVGLVMFTLPGFVAGTALRLRRETAEQLAATGRELELERELFAELTVHNERARIASELHDIVGHALSAMVVQAAAGQRLADRAPEAATASLAMIAESARQGRGDLQRLIDLLVGEQVHDADLSLLEEVVARAARGGLPVAFRLEGDGQGVDPATAHVAYRVVQEGLTNALRHAPGAPVQVLLRGGGAVPVTVRVENGPSSGDAGPSIVGSGRGLQGLRERVVALGGTFTAGPSAAGGWLVEAHLGA